MKDNFDLETIIFECSSNQDPYAIAKMLIDIENDEHINGFTLEKI